MTAMTAKSIREVAAWISLTWCTDEAVAWSADDEDEGYAPKITVQRAGRVLVYEADSIRRLALR